LSLKSQNLKDKGVPRKIWDKAFFETGGIILFSNIIRSKQHACHHELQAFHLTLKRKHNSAVKIIRMSLFDHVKLLPPPLFT
jgi:hypothetical protein